MKPAGAWLECSGAMLPTSSSISCKCLCHAKRIRSSQLETLKQQLGSRSKELPDIPQPPAKTASKASSEAGSEKSEASSLTVQVPLLLRQIRLGW